ncbi:hypothetical protein TNCV_4481791 [Trichonephila clavipes]|nr:hypothetical protein TNCV_4481791 [Trichonephila clavipes]
MLSRIYIHFIPIQVAALAEWSFVQTRDRGTAEYRVGNLVPLKISCVEGLLQVKSVEAQGVHIGVGVAEFDRKIQRDDCSQIGINHHSTLSRQPRLLTENCDKSSWEVDWTWRLDLLTPLHFHPLDFFFWGHLKSLVYETPVSTVEDLTARNVVTSANIASTILLPPVPAVL